MIFLYSFVLLLLGSVKLLVQRRSAVLGRRYSALARSVQSLLTAAHKAAGAGKADLCQLAVQHYELGLLAQKRDRLEARHFAWQAWAERLGRWFQRLRNCQGRTVPYLLGVIDVCLVLAVLEFSGTSAYASAHGLAQLMTELFARN
jgi:hypothetical protein